MEVAESFSIGAMKSLESTNLHYEKSLDATLANQSQSLGSALEVVLLIGARLLHLVLIECHMHCSLKQIDPSR